jgi:hypothetical protein
VFLEFIRFNARVVTPNSKNYTADVWFERMDISRNFGVKQFKTKKEATRFDGGFGTQPARVRQLGTKDQPKLGALLFLNKQRAYILIQIRQSK